MQAQLTRQVIMQAPVLARASTITAAAATAMAVRRFSSDSTRNNNIQHLLKNSGIDSKHGSFATFAEYRKFIIQKDPETMQARFRIMIKDGNAQKLPETEAEQSHFAENVKKVAYRWMSFFFVLAIHPLVALFVHLPL